VSFALANMFFDKKDGFNHIKHLKMASELGHGEARGMLGRLYWGSKLKSKDEIWEFFLFAVANSEPKCRGTYSYHLASLSREEGNSKQYIHWLRRASEDGHSIASYELGAYSLLGNYYCARDRVLARVYLERAMTQEPESKMAEELVIRHFESTDESSSDEASI
jgi:TPR repeat protein